jgi:hypothetical protein
VGIARFLEVGDMLASAINLFLKASLPKSRTTRIYALGIKDEDVSDYATDAINFRVFVVPDLPKWELLTRNADVWTWPFAVVFFEKCTTATASPPPNSWVDPRVLAVDAVMREFGDLRRPTVDGLLSGLRVQEATYTTFVDQEILREEATFWSEIALTYQERTSV